MDDWPELDALIQELREANEERWRRTDELRQQLAGLQPQLEVISRQFQDLRIDEHLRSINDRMLGGLGSVEIVQGGVGIEYAAALVWPGHVHPQGEADDSAQESMYRIEVWLGPGLQDGRARIRIAGSKRLEAFLPTSGERFRSALLTVFRDPQRVSRPAPDQATAQEPTTRADDEHQGAEPDREEPAAAEDA